MSAAAPQSAAGAGGEEQALGKAYDARLLKRLWQYIRPYRREFWLSMGCLPVTSLFSLAQPYILKVTIDRYIATRSPRGVAVMGVLFAVTLVAEFTFLYVQYYLTMLVAQKSLADLRVAIFAHVQQLEAAFFDRNPVGRLVTRIDR